MDDAAYLYGDRLRAAGQRLIALAESERTTRESVLAAVAQVEEALVGLRALADSPLAATSS